MIKSQLYQLTLQRMRLFLREPSAIFWSFGFPVLLTLALGIAFRNRPPEPVFVAIEAGPSAQTLSAALKRAGGIDVAVLPADQARSRLRGGKVVLVVKPGAPLTYVYDPTRPESRLARAVVDDAIQLAEGRKDVTPTNDAHVAEPGARYIDFLVPGLIGSNIMSTGLWGVGYLIVETRTRKLLKRMAATPMRRSHFLLSFVLTRMCFLAIELPVLLIFGWTIFGVVVRGSLVLLMGLAMLGSLAFSGMAVLFAARSNNVQTVTGLINLAILPMVVFSGVFFSHDHFPKVLQPLIRILPLTALNDGMRAVMNEGVSAWAVAPQALVLLIAATVTFTIGLRIFRWN